jgi:hypothetical protein
MSLMIHNPPSKEKNYRSGGKTPIEVSLCGKAREETCGNLLLLLTGF